jgi:hypothetical protein
MSGVTQIQELIGEVSPEARNACEHLLVRSSGRTTKTVGNALLCNLPRLDFGNSLSSASLWSRFTTWVEHNLECRLANAALIHCPISRDSHFTETVARKCIGAFLGEKNDLNSGLEAQ